jgi:hypothetical protein
MLVEIESLQLEDLKQFINIVGKDFIKYLTLSITNETDFREEELSNGDHLRIDSLTLQIKNVNSLQQSLEEAKCRQILSCTLHLKKDTIYQTIELDLLGRKLEMNHRPEMKNLEAILKFAEKKNLEELRIRF